MSVQSERLMCVVLLLLFKFDLLFVFVRVEGGSIRSSDIISRLISLTAAWGTECRIVTVYVDSHVLCCAGVVKSSISIVC